MSSTRSRGSEILDPELRLPRAPGVIRRFWARHPLFSDVLIALVCLLVSIGTAPVLPIMATGSTAAGLAWLTGARALVAVAGCALLLARRRHPAPVFAAALVVELVYLVTLGPGFLAPMAVSVYSLAVYRSSRSSWIGVAVASGVMTVVATATAWTHAVTTGSALNAIMGTAAMALIGALVGVNVGNRKRYLEAVIDRSRQLLVERDQQAQLATAAERERIAREMHDIVSHSLTVVIALTEGAGATDDRERAREATDAAAATARAALAEMRGMLGALRVDDPTAPLEAPQPRSPHDTVAAAQRAGYPVTLTMTGEVVAPPAVQYALGRIVQEGVTNAMRHASATGIHVRVSASPTLIVVDVANDGVGASTGEAAERGFGLQGLAERAGHVGGTLRSGPHGPGRWLLHAELPTGADA